MTEAEQIMKRCQVGTRNHDEANNLHAACYGLIGKLLAQPPLPQRTWVGLTDEDITEIDQGLYPTWKDEVQAIEAKLKEKNT